MKYILIQGHKMLELLKEIEDKKLQVVALSSVASHGGFLYHTFVCLPEGVGQK